MKKRILSIIMAICMVLTLVPTTVFAANGDATALQSLLNGGGTVTLSKNYTIDTTLNVTNTVTLDLKGYTISMTGSGSVINVESGGNLTLQDSSTAKTGVITGGNANSGGGVYVNNGTFTMNGGTIYNCTADVSGGGVYNTGTFTMTDGSIENCTTTNTGKAGSLYNSGVVYANGGEINGTVMNRNGAIKNTNPEDSTKFYSQVENMGTISGGVYYAGIIHGTNSTINGTYYIVSFKLNGGKGSTPATQFFVNTSTASVLKPTAEPTKNGYQAFDGWYNGNTKYNFTEPVTQNITLTAKYSNPITYNISYDLDGGTATNPLTYNIESGAITLNVPTKPGYTFTGWGGTGLTGENNMTVTIPTGSIGDRAYTAHWVDVEAPKGQIGIGTKSWKEFISNITFGLFFKNTQTVTITASDNSGEAVTIEYLLSDKELTAAQLSSADFTAYNGAFSINPDNQYVIYAKLTDFAGNVTYISSNGIVLDATAPVISGIENGKVYCEAQTVTVTEEYIESVKVNGADVALDANNRLTLQASGEQTIIVTDKAGNETSVTVTVNNGHSYEWQSENSQYWKKCMYCGYETAKKDIPTFTIDAPDTVCRTQDCEAGVTLPDGITDAALTFEFIGLGGAIDTTVEDGKLYGVVTADSYPSVEYSFNLVVYATTPDGFPFTVSKTVQIQEEHAGGVATCTELAICDTCGEPYGELDSTNHNLEKISAKDATVTETGNKEYWHCLDCGKYFADENAANEIKLDDTVISKLPPEIIDGDGQSVAAGSNQTLTFRSNALFGDFIRFELDGKTVDSMNYTVKEGSTVVTLNADYVATLSPGKHTIGIVSTGGTATATFTVNAVAHTDKTTKSPETGSNINTALILAFILTCGGVIIVTGAYDKKKKHSEK